MVDTLGTAIDDVSGGNTDALQLAPIIVVATVEQNEIVASHVEAARYEGVYLDLHVVRCKREISLKGGPVDPDLKFYYYMDGRYRDSLPNPRYKRLYQAVPGGRYLFFLTRDRDRLRSVGDVGEYSIRVLSGSHPEIPGEGSDPGRRLSEILLTPGNGADLDGMAHSLSRYSGIADVWGSRLLSVELLRHVFSLAEPLRSQACGVLVESYSGQEDCLQTLAQDASESSRIREVALRILKEKSAQRERLLEELKDPARLSVVADVRTRAEYETILFNPDPVLHERTCRALKRYFPWDEEPKCTGPGRRSHTPE